MSSAAIGFVVAFAVILGALIWWLIRDSNNRRPPGSSGHFSPGDPRYGGLGR
jgi:transposase InsO family protein